MQQMQDRLFSFCLVDLKTIFEVFQSGYCWRTDWNQSWILSQTDLSCVHQSVHIVGWELGLKLFSGWVLLHSLQSRCVTWNCLGPNFSLEPLLCIGFFFQKNIASSAAFEKQRFWLVNENVSVSAYAGKYLVPDSLHPWVLHTCYHMCYQMLSS